MSDQDKGQSESINRPPASTPPVQAEATPARLGHEQRVVSVHTENEIPGLGEALKKSDIDAAYKIMDEWLESQSKAKCCSGVTPDGVQSTQDEILGKDETFIYGGRVLAEDRGSMCCVEGWVYPESESRVVGTSWNEREVEIYRNVPFGVGWLVKFFGGLMEETHHPKVLWRS